MAKSFIEAFASASRKSAMAFNEGDFEQAFAGLAPDVEWRILPSLPDTGVLRGPEEVRRYFEGVLDGLDWQVEPQEFFDAGSGRVLIRQRGHAVGRTTRISGDIDFFQLWEVGEDGLVHTVTEYEQRDDAFAAAGLPASASSQA